MSEMIRDTLVTAAIFGFFASAWFGWAQEKPPAGWRAWLTVGSVLGLIVAAVSGILAWVNWGSATMFDRDTSIVFGWIVLAEVAIAGLGVWILSRRDRGELASPWVAFVVGAHFLPLAGLIEMPLLYVVAGALMVLAPLSVLIARKLDIAVSAVAGVAAGSTLLLFALISLTFAPYP